jgi:enoyl-CoA hydratase/carnithine racemase
VVLNHPEHLNAIDEVMHSELATVFHELGAEKDVRVVVLTGAGRAFSAGGDLEFLTGLSQLSAYRRVMQEGLDIINGILDLPQPIIAAINGPAIGLAANIALCCDISIMSENAYISDPHVPNVGLAAGDGGAVIWPMLIGHSRAKRYLFSGERVNAKTAEQMGLVTLTAPAAEFAALVDEWAMRLASGPTVAIELTKRMVNSQLKAVVQQTLEASLAMEGLSLQSKDHKRALRALKNRKRPTFAGD